MQVQPYVFFDGRCEEAIEFYKKALGAQVQNLMRWKDCPDKSAVKPENENKVMHGHLKIGESDMLVSDGHCNGNPKFEGFHLVMNARDEAEADKVFGALSSGGKVTMPMAKTFFSPRFGMCADKFGIGWMVLIGK